MDGFTPTTDARQPAIEEAAVAASSTPHHDGARHRETAVVFPFARAISTKTAFSPPVTSAASVMLVAPPTSTPVPDFARMVVAGVVARGAAHKNITLAPEERDAVERDVLAGLDLADLYRLAMDDPATMQKAGLSIGDRLDDVAVRRIGILVLYVENKQRADDPVVLDIVTAIVKEVASATATGTIIWPEPAEAVATYYSKTPRIVVEELPHGTITAHFLNGVLHRDPRDGPAREYRDDVRSWSEYLVDDVCHRPASEGPAFIFSHWEGRQLSGEEYVEHGLRHRPASDGPALRCLDRAGNPVIELWCERGERHRDARDGPAWRGIEDGCRIEEYCRHGKLHRDERDGPAVTSHDAKTGALRREAYFQAGELHRESGPADTLHHPDGTITQNWYRHGLLHRNAKDGPACIERGVDGTVLYEAWCRHGLSHRNPRFGPASTWRDPGTGEVREDYYRDGNLHRDPRHGPAVIVRDAVGVIMDQEFWVEGERIDTLEAAEAGA